jgi:hypothetical protein
MLRKYLKDPEQRMEAEPVIIEKDLTIKCHPVRILDFSQRVMWNRTIKYVKILWTNQSEREATWELEDSMRGEYLELFETGKQYLYTYGSVLVLSLAMVNSGTNSFKEGRM